MGARPEESGDAADGSENIQDQSEKHHHAEQKHDRIIFVVGAALMVCGNGYDKEDDPADGADDRSGERGDGKPGDVLRSGG